MRRAPEPAAAVREAAGPDHGALAVALIAYITYNSIDHRRPGSRGVEPGRELLPFAVPLALSDLEGDANVAERACDVRGADVLNVCELAERGPVVLAFFAEPVERCVDEIDVLDRIRGAPPARAVRRGGDPGDRDDLRRACASAAGSCRSATTATARWRTRTRSRSARRSPSPRAAARSGDTAFGSPDERQLEAAIEAARRHRRRAR